MIDWLLRWWLGRLWNDEGIEYIAIVPAHSEWAVSVEPEHTAQVIPFRPRQQ